MRDNVSVSNHSKPYCVTKFDSNRLTDGTPSEITDVILQRVPTTHGATTITVRVPVNCKADYHYTVSPLDAIKEAFSDTPTPDAFKAILVPAGLQSTNSATISTIVEEGETSKEFNTMQLLPGPISYVVISNIEGEGDFAIEIYLQP